MRAIFSIILNGWLSIGPALAAGLPWLALVQLVQVVLGKTPSLSSVILSEGEQETSFSSEGLPSRSRRTSPLFPETIRSGTDFLGTQLARRLSFSKLFPSRITSLDCHEGPSTAARRDLTGKQIFRSPSLSRNDAVGLFQPQRGAITGAHGNAMGIDPSGNQALQGRNNGSRKSLFRPCRAWSKAMEIPRRCRGLSLFRPVGAEEKERLASTESLPLRMMERMEKFFCNAVATLGLKPCPCSAMA